MPGLADAEELQVDPAKAFDGGLVVKALGVQILSHPVGQVGVAGVDVHLPEQVVVHVMAVGIRVGGHQAHIFIQVKGAAEGEIEVFLPVHVDEVPVNTLHGGTCRKTKDHVGIGPQFACNDLGDQSRGGLFCRLNQNFHRANPTRKGSPGQRKRYCGTGVWGLDDLRGTRKLLDEACQSHKSNAFFLRSGRVGEERGGRPWKAIPHPGGVVSLA